jgi:Flp pilus assembly protein TadB
MSGGKEQKNFLKKSLKNLLTERLQGATINSQTRKENTTMEDKNTNQGGVGFFKLLTIAFIILKLCGVINWSWLWVLAPLWIGWVLVFVLLIITMIVTLINEKIMDKLEDY